jgi:hypothetical protein
MSVDPMARLVAANPVCELPDVESPERLRRLIACPHTGEDDALALDLGLPPDERLPAGRGSRMRRRALIAATLCIAASAAGVLLTSGSSGPGVNVAAAAYAATSPRSGVLEAVFLTRVFRGSQAGGTLRQHEWLDSAKRLWRERDSTTGPHGDTSETHVLEFVSAPGRWEVWSSGREANLVTRAMAPGYTKVSIAFGGISLTGVEGIKLYRQLYRKGLMALVGRELHQGRLLWKLESRPIGSADANGRMLAVSETHTRLIVLVDPKTFLPVIERQIDIALPAHPTTAESDLLSYRHYVGGESEGSLFDLAAQHPHARVRTSTTHRRFVSGRRPRHTARSR